MDNTKDNVHVLDVNTTLDIPTDRVVAGLDGVKFDRIMVIGIDEDGDLFCSSSQGRIGDLLLLMERAKDYLLHDVESV